MLKIIWLLGTLCASQDFSHSESEIVVSLADLSELIEQEVLTKGQAIQIWNLWTEAKQNTAMLSYTGFQPKEEGSYIMSLFYGVGSYLIMGIFISAGSFSYNIRSPGLLLVVSLGGTIFFRSIGSSLFVSENSGIISTLLVYLSVVAFALAMHSCMSLLRLTSLDISEDFLNQKKGFRRKIVMSSSIVVFSYWVSFDCGFPLAQLPFFLSLNYLVIMIASKKMEKAPEQLHPFREIVDICFCLSILAYMQYAGSEAFISSYLNEFLVSKGKTVDFRMSGYLFCSIVMSLSVRDFMFVKYSNKYPDYKPGSNIAHEKIIRGNSAKTTYEDWKGADQYIVYYLIFAVLQLIYGLYANIWVMIVCANIHICLCYIIVPRTKNYWPDYLIFSLLTVVSLTVPVLLEGIEDEYSYQVKMYIGDGYIWSTCVFLVIFVMNLANMYCLSTSHLLVLNKKKDEFDGFEYVLILCLRYLLTVLLVCLCESQNNFFVNLQLSLIIIKLNYKPVSECSPADRDLFLASLIIFLTGLKITLLALNISIVFYLGLIMIVSSIYMNTQKYIPVYFYAAIGFNCLFVFHSLCLNSSTSLITSILVFFYILIRKVKGENWISSYFLLLGICFALFFFFFSGVSDLNFFIQDRFLPNSPYLANPEALVPEKAIIISALNSLRNLI